jgi:hypothetical protein
MHLHRAIVVLAMSSIHFLIGCGRSGETPVVEFVLPNGFVGAAELRVSPDSKQPVRTESGYRIWIASEGPTTVTDWSVFRKFSVVVAKFEDGTDLPAESTPVNSELELRFWMSNIVDDQIFAFVGSQREWEAYSSAESERLLSPGR